MSAYRLPELSSPQPVGDKEILLVASGDLRHSANQVSWDAQEEMEAGCVGLRPRRLYRASRSSLRPDSRPRVYFQPAYGHGCLQEDSSRCTADRGGSRLAVQPPRAGRTARSPRPDPDRGQLVGPVPGLVGHAQPERLADQGRRHVQHALERDFHRRASSQGIRQWIRSRSDHARYQPRRDPLNAAALPDAERAWGRRWRAQIHHEKAIMGIFDEGCMGMYNAIIDDELLNPCGVYKERLSQSALVAAMRTVATPTRAGRAMAGRARHEVCHRADPVPRPDRRADSRAVQDVHRRGAHRR